MSCLQSEDDNDIKISILIVVGTCTRPCVAAKPRVAIPRLATGHAAKPRPCEPAAKPRHVAAKQRII